MSEIRYIDYDFERDFDEVESIMNRTYKLTPRGKRFPLKASRELLEQYDKLGCLLGILGICSNGDIRAMYFGTITPWVFNQEHIFATELLWYLDPEFRSFKNLRQLMAEIDGLMEHHEVRAHSIHLPESRKNSVAFKRLGYEKDFSLFTKFYE